jgi:hypothetical protein
VTEREFNSAVFSINKCEKTLPTKAGHWSTFSTIKSSVHKSEVSEFEVSEIIR